jgi:hypothetical protein
VQQARETLGGIGAKFYVFLSGRVDKTKQAGMQHQRSGTTGVF